MVNTGGIDLSEFKGKKIHFALKYTSTDKGGTTWEMKNFLVEEKNDYWDVSLYKEILDNDVVETRSLAATRATTVSPTASALYVYDGENKTWKPYTLKEAKLLVAEPALYESLGADMIEKPEAVLPTYLKQKYLTLLWVTWLRWSTTRKPIRLWLPNTRWERTGQRQLPVSSSLPPLRRMPRHQC
mgnify:CR=1 FL=1